MTSTGTTGNYNVNTLVLFFILIFFKMLSRVTTRVYFAYTHIRKFRFDFFNPYDPYVT